MGKRFDLERAARKVSRALGCDVQICHDAIFVEEPLGTAMVKLAMVKLGTPSNHERALRSLHEQVYHARGQQAYLLQSGLCGICEKPLNGLGEIDHIKARSKGRDDRIENLRVVHAECHRKRHGG